MSPSTTTGAVHQDEVDPLHEPVLHIFVYASWALTNWLLAPTVALVVLVACTGMLGVAALAHDPGPRHRRVRPTTHHTASFVGDFSAIILFCSASIAAGVLTVQAVTQAPRLGLALVLISASAGCLAYAAADHFQARRPALG